MVSNCTALSNAATGFTASFGASIIHCNASINATDGIVVDNSSAVANCTTEANGSGAAGSGIVTKANCVVSSCTAGLNKASGISCKSGCAISHCAVQSNNGTGIQVTDSCHLTACSSTNNGSGTTGSGIAADIRSTISDCSAIGNKADGIVFSGDSFVLNNHASTNGGAGFHDVGGASRIDGNVSRENTGIGILAGANDTVVRNNSGANGGVPYGPTAGPNWGPTGGTANTSTSPWANF
jgi:hypothetical protein